MDFQKHLIYQDLIANTASMDHILDVFERVLTARGLWDSESRLADAHVLAQEEGRPVDVVRIHDALLVEVFLDTFEPDDVEEYVNLARKERLARIMLRELNHGKADTARVLELLNEFCAIPLGRYQVAETVTLGIRVDLISQFISDHLSYIGIAKNFITMRDVADALGRAIGTGVSRGLVGGKAAGMLLANLILRPTLQPHEEIFDENIEEAESYFLKSSVASEFVDSNRLEECHSLKYLEGDAADEARERIRQRFLRARFSNTVLERLREVLGQTEGAPLILRSSSYLEDGVGFSFTGKYDSVFISNRGSDDERLRELTDGLKRVLFSIYNRHAIEYRRDKNLLDYNERMSVLIQKVIGSACGDYFFPSVAMVGFSKNPYCWSGRIRPQDGMLRMVMGLGTRAVDRVGDDYPRLVSLTEPTLRPEVTTAEKIKYSQRYVDVLNLESRRIESHHFVDLVNAIHAQGHRLPVRDIISVEKDGVLTRPVFEPDELAPGRCAITFDGLLSGGTFPELMRRVLSKVGGDYGMPVDMEFAYHGGKLVVLQCRHLSERSGAPEAVDLPSAAPQDVLFTARKDFASAVVKDIEYVVRVDSAAYGALTSAERKLEVARIVGRVNRALAGKRFVLMGPGRWGTTNLELGVRVQYSEINNALMLIEVARKKGDVTPEVSHGTHFFQDLVEADIIPLPLYPDDDGVVFRAEFFANAGNRLPTLDPEHKDYAGVVSVIHVPSESGGRKLQVYLDDRVPEGVGFLE